MFRTADAVQEVTSKQFDNFHRKKMLNMLWPQPEDPVTMLPQTMGARCVIYCTSSEKIELSLSGGNACAPSPHRPSLWAACGRFVFENIYARYRNIDRKLFQMQQKLAQSADAMVAHLKQRQTMGESFNIAE